MICFVVTYSWYYIWSNEVLSKNEEEVAAKRSMKNLKMTMHRQRFHVSIKKNNMDNYQMTILLTNNHGSIT